MINVLIADDHPIVRAGLRRILEDAPLLRIVGEATNGDELLELLRSRCVDVVLLDIGMPGTGFLEILRRVRELCPPPRVLVLSVYPEEQYAPRAFRAGAAGYLSKSDSPEKIVHAIRHVHAGGRYVSAALAEWMAARLGNERGDRAHDMLSDRELQVLGMMGAGMTVTAIGNALALSVKTVSTYRTRIRKKLGLNSTAELIRYAIDHDIASQI